MYVIFSHEVCGRLLQQQSETNTSSKETMCLSVVTTWIHSSLQPRLWGPRVGS